MEIKIYINKTGLNHFWGLWKVIVFVVLFWHPATIICSSCWWTSFLLYRDKILSIERAATKSWSVNNQLITYYLPVCYSRRIQQYPVNTTYNNCPPADFLTACSLLPSLCLNPHLVEYQTYALCTMIAQNQQTLSWAWCNLCQKGEFCKILPHPCLPHIAIVLQSI